MSGGGREIVLKLFVAGQMSICGVFIENLLRFADQHQVLDFCCIITVYFAFKSFIFHHKNMLHCHLT